EPPAMRYRVDAAQGDPRRLRAHRAERRAHGPDHQVLLARRRRLAALAGHLDGQPAVGDARLDLVVERQRQAQRVEPRPQVGAGGGRAHPGRPLRPGHAAHARPSAAEAAAGSTWTVTGAGAADTAQSGSFSPLPVIVQTTRDPASSCPFWRAWIRPATPAADASSPNTASWPASI